MKTYIHYGHKHFMLQKFREIRNRQWVKPTGGLWASSKDAPYGWKQWCENENFRECSEENSFCFVLAAGANVLHIHRKEDLIDIPEEKIEYRGNMKFLDFEAIKNSGIDAIELHLSEDYRLYWDLYGWDCDCILIMNPDIVIEKGNGSGTEKKMDTGGKTISGR